MDIHEAIMAAPLLQRAAVQEQYKGLYVEWDAYLQSARKEKNGDIVRLSLKPAKATEPGWLLDIGCKVSITDYKELSILKAGAPLRVSGRMAEVGEWNVELTDARLTFQGS